MKSQARRDWAHIAEQLRQNPALLQVTPGKGKRPYWLARLAVLHPWTASLALAVVVAVPAAMVGGLAIALAAGCATLVLAVPGALWSRQTVGSLFDEDSVRVPEEPHSNVRRVDGAGD